MRRKENRIEVLLPDITDRTEWMRRKENRIEVLFP